MDRNQSCKLMARNDLLMSFSSIRSNWENNISGYSNERDEPIWALLVWPGLIVAAAATAAFVLI